MKKNVFKILLMLFTLCLFTKVVYADSTFDDYERILDEAFKNNSITINYEGELNAEIVNRYVSDFLDNKGVWEYMTYSATPNDDYTELTIRLESYEYEELIYTLDIIHNKDIDTKVFDYYNIDDILTIEAEEPTDPVKYFSQYISLFNFYSPDDYNYRISIFHRANDEVIIIGTDKDTGRIDMMDADYTFVGYSNVMSDEYWYMVGESITINADSIELFLETSSLGNNMYLLGRTINEDGIGDVGYFNETNDTLEIHQVQFNLNTEISSEFKEYTNLRKGSVAVLNTSEDMDDTSFNYSNRISQEKYVNFNCYEGECTVRYNDYFNDYSEVHKFEMRTEVSEPSDDYVEKIGTEINVYPGVHEDFWGSLESKYGSNGEAYCDWDKYCYVSHINSDGDLEKFKLEVNIKEGFSPEMRALFPTNEINVNSIHEASDESGWLIQDEAITAYIRSKTRRDVYFEPTEGNKGLIYLDGIEAQEFEIIYTPKNSTIASKVNTVYNDLKERFKKPSKKASNIFIADDMEFVNMFRYNVIGDDHYETISFNEALKTSDPNISYRFVPHGGAGGKYFGSNAGNLLIYYDGVAYKLYEDICQRTLNIIYIPSNTANTIDAYIEAAEKRIEEYFGENSGIKIRYNGKYDERQLLEYNYYTYSDLGISESKLIKEEFVISYGSNETYLLLSKDSNKIKKSTFAASDIINNVKITSDTATYPTNTIVNSEIYDSNTNKYKDTMDELNFEDGYVVDMSLYSNKVGEIDDYNDDTFKVKIPLKDFKYGGLDLYAHFIKEDGTVEKYKVTVDYNGFATFETTHFSTYIIADKDGKVGTEVPKIIDVTATPSYNKVKLSWNDITGATSYKVYKCDSDGSDCKRLTTTTSTTYTHTSLSLNKTYYYKVYAYDGSTKILTSSLTKAKTLLDKPVIIGITDNRYRYTRVEWDKVSGATKYYLYRCDSDGKNCKKVDDTAKTSYTTYGGSEGTTYIYKVRAYRSGVYSSYSAGVEGKKLKDTISFSISKPEYRKVKITISHLDTAKEYYIYRATSKTGTYTKIATLEATGEPVSYTDSVTFNKKYYYKIKANNGYNSSDYSSNKYLTANTMNKAVITSVTNNRYRYTIVKWNKVLGATSYNLFRCTDNDTCTKVANTKNTSYTTTGGSEGVTYIYKVRPLVGSVAGITSDGVEGKKLKDTISFGVKNNSYRTIDITINHLEGAKKYYIYRATSKNGTYSKIATLEATGETIVYKDTSRTFNKTYYYKVKAYNGYNTSDYSSYKYVKADGVATPEAMAHVAENNVTLNVSKVTGATGYEYYYSTDGENYKLLKRTTSTSYSKDYDIGEYYFKIRAYRKVNGKYYYGNYKILDRVVIISLAE